MRRKPLFLAASAVELLRFLAISFAAEALGTADAGRDATTLLRYASAPGLLFPAAFFFLWLDAGRYAPFRLLLVAGKLVSLSAMVPLGLTVMAAFSPEQGPRDYRGAFSWSVLILVAELLSLATAALYGREPRAASPPAGKVEFLSRPLASEPSRPQPPGQSGPRGPEDIEGVEA